jgi:hypothetical protein
MDRENAMSQEQPNDPRRSEAEKETKPNPVQAQPDPDQSDSMDRARPGPDKQGAHEPTRPMPAYDAPEVGGPLPDLDEGPRPRPVDDVQEALFEAAKEEQATDVDLDELPEPLPELDEGPRPGPVDDVQEALFEAAQEGAPTELDFEHLPEPGAGQPRKVVKFPHKAPDTVPTPKTDRPAEPGLETIPLPEFPDPDPAPTVSDFWPLLALFVTFRLLALFLLRPGGFIRDWSDFDTYFGIAALSDYSLYPFLNFWLEWPPVVPWLAVATYQLSLWLPPWSDDPRLWFILILGAVFVLFEVGNFVLIDRLARRLFESSTTVSRVLWLYAGLFPPIYAMLGFFDGMALFFILLSLDLLLDDRRFPSAIAAGIGFMVKVLPGLMLPVALRRLWHQYRTNSQDASIELGLYSVIFGLTILALLGPFLVAGPEWVLASARSMVGRASWETVWAVIEGYYGFGSVLGDRLNPAETNFAVHQGTLPWLHWLTGLAFAAIYGYLFTRPADYSRPRNMVALSGLTVALFMLYAKGYSPQFLVYLLPFILLIFPDGRGLTYALVLTGLNVLEQPVYFVLLPAATWLLTFIVIARFLLIGLLALEFAVILWPLELHFIGLAEWRRRLPLALAGLAVVALVILMPLLLWAYGSHRLQTGPVATFVRFMQTQRTATAEISPGPPRMLVSDQATYRQIYPYLSDDFDLRLAGGASQYNGAPGVVDLLEGTDTVWILPTGAQQETLRNIVTRRSQTLASYEFEGLGVASLHSFRGNISPFIAPARFSTGIELLAHEVDVQSGAVNVSLYWRALNPQSQSLTVFAQLLDADGKLVASQDSIPANGATPTTDWTTDAIQVDPHRIELPADLPAGDYTLIIGLYNNFTERIRAIAPNGFGFANRAVPLEVLRLP